MNDYTSKQPFGKDVMPHNKEASFVQPHNSPAKIQELRNGGSTDGKPVQKMTKSDATSATRGGAFGSFIGSK